MSVYVCVCLLNTQRIFISATYCHICNEYKREKETHITEIYFISHKTYDEMKVDESVVSASSTLDVQETPFRNFHLIKTM